MNNPLAAISRHWPLPVFSTRSFLQRGIFSTALALCVASPSSPLLANVSDDISRSNTVSSEQERVAWMSGGIGDEARDEMRRVAADYNVHLVFSNRDGAYLADIPFTVSRADGVEIHSGVSEGPLLYLQLPPGNYRVSAQINGVWQSKRIHASRGGRITRSSFIARNE